VLVVEHRHEVDAVAQLQFLNGLVGDRALFGNGKFGHDDAPLPEVLDVAGGGEPHDLHDVARREVVGPHHVVDVEGFAQLGPGGEVLRLGDAGDGEGAVVQGPRRTADQDVAAVVARAPDHEVGVLHVRRFQHVDPGPVALVGEHVGLGPDRFEAVGIFVDRDDLVLFGQRVGHTAADLPDPDDDDFHEEETCPSLKELKREESGATRALARRRSESLHCVRLHYTVPKMAPAEGKYNPRIGAGTDSGGGVSSISAYEVQQNALKGLLVWEDVEAFFEELPLLRSFRFSALCTRRLR